MQFVNSEVVSKSHCMICSSLSKKVVVRWVGEEGFEVTELNQKIKIIKTKFNQEETLKIKNQRNLVLNRRIYTFQPSNGSAIWMK